MEGERCSGRGGGTRRLHQIQSFRWHEGLREDIGNPRGERIVRTRMLYGAEIGSTGNGCLSESVQHINVANDNDIVIQARAA